MSTTSFSFFRALPLVAAAGLLAGCPVVEPVEPESPVPHSGVWGMHIVDVTAVGLCANGGLDVSGRVLRLDVDAAQTGELGLGLLGIDLHGGHADRVAWADLELPLPGWARGLEEEPDIAVDEPEWGGGEEEDSEEGCRDDAALDESGDAPPPCMEIHEEGDPRERAESSEEPRLHIAFDADIASAFAMDGTLALTVSSRYGSCTFEASVDASYIGEEGDMYDHFGDDFEVVFVEESVPGSAGPPSESEVD